MISRRAVTTFAVCLLLIGGSQIATASLLTNGTFDTNLSGWTIGAGTTTGVTWSSGTAHIGRPGTPGVAIFEQSFNIPAGAGQLEIGFDYEWQVSKPTNTDTFLVELVYQSTSGPVTATLLTQGSDTATFGPPATSFQTVVGLSNLSNVANNGTLRFKHTEVKSPVGTRMELDNVAADVVPEMSAFVVWTALTGVGMVVGQRRR